MNLEDLVEIGKTNKLSYRVKEADTAKAMGSGEVKLLATPVMMVQMEKAATALMKEFLPDEWIDLGVEVFVRHFKSVRVGEEVVVEARIVKVKGSRVTFEVGMDRGSDVIGRGVHVRQIVDVKRVKTLVEG